MKKLKKSDKILLLITILILPGFYFFGQFVMIWNKTTCAVVQSIEKSKGIYVVYSYEVEGEKIVNYANISYFRYDNLDSLKKKPCFLIQYSTILPKYTRIIDKDLKAE